MTRWPFSTIETAALRTADRLLTALLDDLSWRKGPAEDLARFQARYARALRNILEGRVASLRSLALDRGVHQVTAQAERRLGPEFAEQAEPVIRRMLERVFRVGQAVRGVPRSVQVLFDRPRQEAVDWLVQHDRFWLGKVFPTHVREAFRDTIVAGLEEGLGRKAIGSQLRDLLLGTEGVPGKVELYTRVAAASVNRAHNWGGLMALEAAGVERYVFRAVGDERTSAICRHLNGQVFPVARTMAVVREALAGPPSAIATLAPWPTYDTQQDDFFIAVGDRRTPLKDKSPDWLADHGVALPPLHGHCRSVVVLAR